MPTVHAFVISWPGVEDNARHIADRIQGTADAVTVLHSCRNDEPMAGRPGWIQVPDAEYYGTKFARTLALNRGEVMLHLHADARTPDWARVVRRCREAHHVLPNLGVWATDADHTPFPLDEVRIGELDDGDLVPVAQTDSIVWSVSAPVIARLRRFDLSVTPLGWGLDWAAICFAITHNLMAVRDRTLRVEHPRGSGYRREEAALQMLALLDQQEPAEKVVRHLLAGHIEARRAALGRRPAHA